MGARLRSILAVALAAMACRVPAHAAIAPGLQTTVEPGALHLRAELTPEALPALPLRWPLGEGEALPFAAWLIALPEEAAGLPQLSVRDLRTERIPTLTLPATVGNAISQALPTGWPVHVERVGVVRGVSLARVQFFPARPLPEGWEVVRALSATVRWPVPRGELAPLGSKEEGLLRSIRAQVVNPSEVAPRRASIAPAARQAYVTPLALVDVSQPGLVAITRAALAQAGVGVGSPHRLRLRQGAIEVPMLWEGDADDAFEDDERLLFYAAPRFSRYADHDTWALEVADAPVARMASRDVAPGGQPSGALYATLRFEQNALYTPDCGCRPPAHRDGDRWAWVNLQRGQTWSYAFTLPLTGTQPVTITAWLIGYTDPPQNPDHRAQLWLNGALAGEVAWDGRQAITMTALAYAGPNNTLSVTLPGLSGVSVEGMWLDAFAVTLPTVGQAGLAPPWRGETAAHRYRLRFLPLYVLDVTTPTHPTRLTGWHSDGSGITFADTAAPLPRDYATFTDAAAPLRVRAPAALNAASGDFHIIAPDALLPVLAPLASRRQAQGLTVVTQTIQAVYDHYGDGRADPLAIRAYFAAHYREATPPAYALLVGDGTLDPKRYRAASPPTLIPPFLAEVEPRLGETAADNRFVAVDGDDALPDIALGRWPVNTLTETQALVRKTLAYEDALLTAADRLALVVADDADAGGNFPAKASALAQAVPAPYVGLTAAMVSSAALTDTRHVLLGRWPQARLLAYFGHASPRQWAVERLLHRDDAPALPPRDTLPVVVGLTCYTSRFHELQDTLDETLVRVDGRGAVATWGATGLTLSAGHDALGDGFAASWLGGARLGDAALAGKLSLAAGGSYLDMLDTYTLLGDPTLRINQRWATHTNYLPVMKRVAP